MKLSFYNVFFSYDGQIVGYNGLSNEYLLIDPDLYALLEAVKKQDTLPLLQEKHPDFYECLHNKAFIVKKEKDELAACLAQLNANDSNNTHYELHINPTMNCNFKCWYCYETHIKDSKLSPQIQENILKLVEQIVSNPNLKSLQLNWFGGEPLLYFDKTIFPLMVAIKNKCAARQIRFFSLITSNGLLINDSLINKCKENNTLHFQITLDGHRERHNQVRFISEHRGSYDKIIQNIKKLILNGIYVNIRINCSKETFEGLERIADDFSDIAETYRNFFSFDFHKVWQIEMGLGQEIDTFTELFRNRGFRVFSLNANIAKYSCYADKRNHAMINYNGDVFKCTARDFSAQNKEGILNNDGNIIWNDRYQARFNLKYTNEPCQTCTIFPVCGSGCSQHSLENQEKNYCIYDYDEDKKTEVILNKFLSLIQ